MRNPNWLPTSFKHPDGTSHVAPDDWTLYDDAGQPLARIYRYLYGPNAGRWLWIVLSDRPGTGYAVTCSEALEMCEGMVRPLRCKGSAVKVG